MYCRRASDDILPLVFNGMCKVNAANAMENWRLGHVWVISQRAHVQQSLGVSLNALLVH